MVWHELLEWVDHDKLRTIIAKVEEENKPRIELILR